MTSAVQRTCLAVLMVAGCGGSKSKGNGTGDMAVASGDMAVASGDMAVASGDMAVASGGDMTAGDLATSASADMTITTVDNYQGFLFPNNDNVTFTIDHGASTITIRDVTSATPFTLAGTVETLPSGYLRENLTKGCNGLGCTPTTVTSINGPDASTIKLPIGAHGIEVPGYYVLVIPDHTGNNNNDAGSGGDNGAALVGVATKDCTNASGTYNMIDIAPTKTDNLSTDIAYLQITLAGAAATPTVTPVAFKLGDATGTSVGAPTSPMCTNGHLTFTGDASEVFQSGSNGVLVLSSPTDDKNSASLGFVQSAITLADLENHTYNAVAFQSGNGNGGGGASQIVFGASATGVATNYVSVDDNTLDTNAADQTNVTLTSVTNGLVSVTASGTGMPTSHLQGAVLKVGNTNMMVLIGAQDSDKTQIVNIIAYSK